MRSVVSRAASSGARLGVVLAVGACATPEPGVGAAGGGGAGQRLDAGRPDVGSTARSAAPVISPDDGAYPFRTPISISSPEADASIHYTLDGSAPSELSTRYEGPILLSTVSLSLRAVAVAPGKGVSEIATGRFDRAPGMVLHFKKPGAWPSALIHHWGTTPDGTSTTWPGLPMTPEGDGWYAIQLEGQTSARLVFNGGPSPQTRDLYWNQPEGWFVPDAFESNGKLDGDFWDVPPERMDCCSFPHGLYKAVAMSFDDGGRQDIQLADLFAKHGIRGTFNLNSGLMGWPEKVHADEVKSVYAGHEVAAHSVDHPHIGADNDTAEALAAEMLDDKIALEALVGYPVRGSAFPFGDYTPLLLDLMPTWGFRYSRVVPATGDLRLPGDFFVWRSSAHHSGALPIAQALVSAAPTSMSLLYVWGHSWELDANQPNNGWQYMSDLCALIGHRDDVWYATVGDLTDYLKAVRSLEISASEVHNPSSLSVWVKRAGEPIEVGPGATEPL